MKVKVIKDAFYNKALVREGSIIETSFTKNNMPSWAIPFKEDKKTEPTKPVEPTEPTQPTKPVQPENVNELKAELEVLKDIAIDNDIFIEVDETDIVAAIEKLKTELETKGIKL